MKKLSTTLLLTIFTVNTIVTMQHTKLPNLSENPLNSNYKVTILLLHISIQIFTTQSLPIVQAYQIHSRKYTGEAQTISLNAFIILLRYLGQIINIYQMCIINSQKITVA